MTSYAAIFRALAEGEDLQTVREKFRLSEEALQEVFREVADYYYDLEEQTWSLYCDGASRGNPGPAGAGMVLVDPYGETRLKYGEYLGETTNNVAEYRALLKGLEMAQTLGIKKIQVFTDCELLVRQINGSYRVKKPHLLPLWQEAKKALAKFAAHAVSHVPRELNHQADRVANQAIDQQRAAR